MLPHRQGDLPGSEAAGNYVIRRRDGRPSIRKYLLPCGHEFTSPFQSVHTDAVRQVPGTCEVPGT